MEETCRVMGRFVFLTILFDVYGLGWLCITQKHAGFWPPSSWSPLWLGLACVQPSSTEHQAPNTKHQRTLTDTNCTLKVPMIANLTRIMVQEVVREVPKIITQEVVKQVIQQAPQIIETIAAPVQVVETVAARPQIIETIAAPQVYQQPSFGTVSMGIPTQTVGAYGGGIVAETVGTYGGGLATQTAGAYGGVLGASTIGIPTQTVGAYGGGISTGVYGGGVVGTGTTYGLAPQTYF